MSSAHSFLRTRVRALPPRTLDLVLAALVLLATAAEVAFADATATERAAAALPAAVAAAAVWARRRQPLLALALAIAALTATAALDRDVWNALNAIYLVLLFVTYSMAARESGPRLTAGVALAVAGVVVAAVALQDRDEEGSLAAAVAIGLAFFVVAPVAAGRLLHSRLALSAALGQKAQRLEAVRARRAEEAATAERTRIAGELHDVVAHALGAMTVQAAAARRLAVKDAGRAAGAFEAIETTGRDALGELRTLLDALRDDASGEPLHATRAALTALPELARRARSAGLAVDYDISGASPGPLPAGVDLSAYRVVQEALQAALQRGCAETASVRLRYRPDRLEIEVADDGSCADTRPLLGLHERVNLYGGEVEVAVESGGHVVRAWLPLEPVPA